MEKSNKNKLDISTAEQAHGKVETSKVTRLDQILGDNGFGKYKTFDKGDYEKTLKEMNTAELRRHASKMGIMPVVSRERLMKRLLVEFAKHVAVYKPTLITKAKEGTISVAGSRKRVSEAAVKIMSECK